ncbi:hypothetical protein RB614_29595 [Phytohabitans sp. ZYX-F-186]|uniref:Uncharacterized protein n=1 Tax=Phytohabitans maris TaxID=3071409 RepID=A0ABU0ZNV8_9ACTN|nr:hypothetical protein [Phytohabitans sp. ZYX-F-186]MDQ7908695.1 hypothetical protein [Phytohabitans sp. ZYX-F-186]
MSSHRTFVDACLAGEALLSEIDSFVEAWHEDDSVTCELPEYLGMSSDDYRLWVERPESLRFILAAHKNRTPVTELLVKRAGLRAAARGEEKGEAVQVLRWLIETGRVDERYA